MHCGSSLKIAWVAKETSLLCPHPASNLHPTTRFLNTSVHTTKIYGSTKIQPGWMISLSGPWTTSSGLLQRLFNYGIRMKSGPIRWLIGYWPWCP